MATGGESNGDNTPASTTKLTAKDSVPKLHPVKKQSIDLTSSDNRNSSNRRKSLTIAPPSPNMRRRLSRPFDNIAEESEALHVSPLAKIIWFAKQGLWQALDSFLDKLFQEGGKIQLRFDSDLLSV